MPQQFFGLNNGPIIVLCHDIYEMFGSRGSNLPVPFGITMYFTPILTLPPGGATIVWLFLEAIILNLCNVNVRSY